MFNFFGTPKCPHCGGKTKATGHAFPFPQLRCDNCIRYNKLKAEIEKLKNENLC